MWNARLDEAQAGIKTAGRNFNNLRYADDTKLIAESEEKLKSFLMKVKEESEKAGLKLNIQKTKIMATSPIMNRQAHNGNSNRLDFLGLQNHRRWWLQSPSEIKRYLLLGRKGMTNLDSILKSRDITWLTKVHLVKAMVFPVLTYRCESWTIRKAEHHRTDAFELWRWRRLLRVPWTARRSNQTSQCSRKSVLNIHCGDWCWSSNTWDTWCEELTHLKRHWCWESMKAGGEGDEGRWDGWMASLTWWTWVWACSGS